MRRIGVRRRRLAGPAAGSSEGRGFGQGDYRLQAVGIPKGWIPPVDGNPSVVDHAYGLGNNEVSAIVDSVSAHEKYDALMKSIVCVNAEVPTVENSLSYSSDGSLLDYDIVIFNPQLPYYDRINFSAGGSCVSIEDTKRFHRETAHWFRELSGALSAGKTIFVMMGAYEEDQAALASTTAAKTTSYQTTAINNYSLIPGKLRVRNARGRGIVVKDPLFKGAYEAVKDITEYRVVFEPSSSMRTVFAAKDGTPVGGVVSVDDKPGSLVLLPHFDFEVEDYIENDDWNKTALRASNAFVGQLVAIDRALRGSAQLTPPPSWVTEFEKPKAAEVIDAAVSEIDAQIGRLREQRRTHETQRAELDGYSHLLYETGKPLERAIEKVLRLLGYTVETLRIGDLEIDHVIESPTGLRMIGESEGKDTSAIDISKFRQLESNIGEDFERDEVDLPAKGVLFGNGYRLSAPGKREEQFTKKSLTNAKRLGSALIRTPDLYPVALHLLDHPDDDAYRAACRASIEETVGGVVEFPRK